MVYRIDNRPKKHRGRFMVIGIILGIVLGGGGLYMFENYKEPIIQNVKDVVVSEIPKTVNSPIEQSQNSEPAQNQIQTTETPQETSSPNIQIDVSSLEQQIHIEINAIRVQNGLQPLTYDNQIASIAREHSKDMALNNYFDHISPNGQTLRDRYMIGKYPCFAAGENIEQSYTSYPNLADQIVQTWINSPEHKQNILAIFYGHEGIGVYADSDNIWITEDFC